MFKMDSGLNIASGSSHLSSLEKLPTEIIEKILICLMMDTASKSSCIGATLPVSPTAKVEREPCLYPSLLASRKLYNSTLSVLYRHPKLVQPHKLEEFVTLLERSPTLGSYVRSLDLTELEEQISTTDIERLTSVTPLLTGFKLHIHGREKSGLKSENLEGFMDSLNSCPNLSHLSLRNFDMAFPAARSDEPEPTTSGLEDFHKLQVLDLGRSSVFSEILETVSPFARLTSLTIGLGLALSVDSLVDFLTSPSARDSLQSLRIEALPDLIDEADTTHLISALPTSLRTLDMGSCPMSSSQIPDLRDLASCLEELTLGPGISMSDIEDIVLDPGWDFSIDDSRPQLSNEKHSPLMDATRHAVEVCNLRLRLSSVTWVGEGLKPSKSGLKYLGIQNIAVWEQTRIAGSVLLAKHAVGLEVIEVSPAVFVRKEGIKTICSAIGWRKKGVGRRAWIGRL